MNLDGLQHVDIPNSHTDCYGAIAEMLDVNGLHYICRTCGAKLPPEEVVKARWLLDRTDANCPHCHQQNEIDGFGEFYICAHCGKEIER